VTELTFNAGLYDGAALAAAVDTYRAFATCTVEPGRDAFRVQVTATGKVAEDRVVSEFCNYALGATIERQRAVVRGPGQK
jgi:hypothetical protein